MGQVQIRGTGSPGGDRAAAMAQRKRRDGGADFTLASDFRGDNLSVSVGGGGDFLAKKPMRIQNGEFSTGGGGDMFNLKILTINLLVQLLKMILLLD